MSQELCVQNAFAQLKVLQSDSQGKLVTVMREYMEELAYVALLGVKPVSRRNSSIIFLYIVSSFFSDIL